MRASATRLTPTPIPAAAPTDRPDELWAVGVVEALAALVCVEVLVVVADVEAGFVDDALPVEVEVEEGKS
jgi:hypothetical protein